MSELFVWVLVTLTAYRLWRLVALDVLTQPARDLIPTRMAYPVTCPWCSGTWVTAATFAVALLFVEMRLPVLQAAAASTVVGWVGTLDADHVLEE